MDNRENNPSSGDTIIKRHLFSELAQKKLEKGSRVGEGVFVCRPNRQGFGFRVAASSGPILKAPGSAGGYLLQAGKGWKVVFSYPPNLHRRSRRCSTYEPDCHGDNLDRPGESKIVLDHSVGPNWYLTWIG